MTTSNGKEGDPPFYVTLAKTLDDQSSKHNTEKKKRRDYLNEAHQANLSDLSGRVLAEDSSPGLLIFLLSLLKCLSFR